MNAPTYAPIERAALAFFGWGYATKDADVRFPALGPSLPASRLWSPADAMLTNCSSFGAAILVGRYPSGAWTSETYAGLQIFHPDQRPFSPVEAVVAAGVGRRVETPQAYRWHICQGWRSLRGPDRGDGPTWVKGDKGHTWFWLCLDDDLAGKGLVLEATKTASFSGIRSFETTWSARVAPYKAGVRIAALRRRTTVARGASSR